MDFISVLTGLIIGALIAGFVGWKIGNSKANTKSRQLSDTENEIKQLIGQKAQAHIETTKSAVENMQVQLTAIQEQLAGFESGLNEQRATDSNTEFYSENTSLYLRNSPADEKTDEYQIGDDYQPRDFSVESSGVFVDETEKRENN